MASEIVKILRPLSGNASEDPWLIYDRGRTHREVRPEAKVDAEIKTAVGSDPKGYFEAHWSTEGWKIGPQVPAEDW